MSCWRRWTAWPRRCARKRSEFDDIVKSGRTHLQDAVPVRLGQEFGGYARAVERDAERIRRSAEGLRRLGIGGTAAGTGLNAHPEYHARMVQRLSELTGLALYTSDNLFESMQSMADAADFSAALRTLAITLTRIANDFRLLASGPCHRAGRAPPAAGAARLEHHARQGQPGAGRDARTWRCSTCRAAT